MKACTSAPVVPVIAKGPVPSRFMDPPDSSASPAESAFAAEVTGDEARSALPGPDDQTPAWDPMAIQGNQKRDIAVTLASFSSSSPLNSSS